MKLAKQQKPKAQKKSTKAPTKVAKRGLKTAVNGRRVAAATKKASMSATRKMSVAPNNGFVEGPSGKRPISPSIQIWKFSPTAYLHVGVRIAGCVLTGGFAAAGLTAAFVTPEIPEVIDSLKVSAPLLIPVLKAAVVAPLTFHAAGGVRQLYQDFTAKGYNNEFQDQTSYAMAGVTAAATLYAAAI